jgi:hypothetical protein
MADIPVLLTEQDDIPVPEALRMYLDEHYLAHLPNLQIARPTKLVIIFSGGNAVGKSSLSKAIQNQLGGVILENDAVRAALLAPDAPQFGQTGDHRHFSGLAWTYILDLYHRLDSVTKNGLIIRDAVVDWYFDRILPVFEQQGYELFIVRFELSRQKRIELIRKRGGKDWISTERMEELLDQHDYHSARFLDRYTPNMTLHDDDLFDYQKVVNAIRAKLDALLI